MRIIWSILYLCALLGCALPGEYDFTDERNFRDRIVDIRAQPYSFFSGARKDKDKSCFPPSGKPLCGDRYNWHTYEAIEPLKIESYAIQVKDSSPLLLPDVNELIHLIGAELTLQRKFTHFIVTRTNYVGSCHDSYSAQTIGSTQGDMYIGATSLLKDTFCSGIAAIEILIFDDYEKIKSGVFYQSKYSTNMDVGIYADLYLDMGEKINLKNKLSPSNLDVPLNAWKQYYEASAIASALRSKYKVSPKIDYQITSPQAPKKSFLEQFKISN